MSVFYDLSLSFHESTYFVEYMLPRTSTSSRHVYGKSNNGDVARVASSKVTGGGMSPDVKDNCLFILL